MTEDKIKAVSVTSDTFLRWLWRGLDHELPLGSQSSLSGKPAGQRCPPLWFCFGSDEIPQEKHLSLLCLAFLPSCQVSGLRTWGWDCLEVGGPCLPGGLSLGLLPPCWVSPSLSSLDTPGVLARGLGILSSIDKSIYS